MEYFQIKKILLPYDFSEKSSNALNTALVVAQQQHASLTILHVIDTPPTIRVGKFQAVTAPLQQLSRVVNENLNILVKTLLSTYDVPIDYVVDAGEPAFVIGEYAWANDIDLIVIGKAAGGQFKKYFFESVSYKVIKNSNCPVLSVPQQRLFTRFHKIVFPVRNSPAMLEKYDATRAFMTKDKTSVIVAGLTPERDDDSYKCVLSLVKGITGKLQNDGFTFETRVDFCESMSGRVIELSREETPDMIAITAHVSSHFKSVFLDYYSKMVLSNANCPVLTIKPGMVSVN